MIGMRKLKFEIYLRMASNHREYLLEFFNVADFPFWLVEKKFVVVVLVCSSAHPSPGNFRSPSPTLTLPTHHHHPHHQPTTPSTQSSPTTTISIITTSTSSDAFHHRIAIQSSDTQIPNSGTKTRFPPRHHHNYPRRIHPPRQEPPSPGTHVIRTHPSPTWVD